MPASYSFEPIGVVRSPFAERIEAPRQAAAATGVEGRIELFEGRGFEHALEGLAGWEYAWVLFVFHKNVEEGRGWKPKVLPPRATEKQGVFATRSPHRPNPIGMSAVRIERVEGLVVHVRELDLLDGTPVLDLKPYVPYADAHPGARSGWLEARDPLPSWQVAFADVAGAQLVWLEERGVALRAAIESALALGPQPHPYRRIRAQAEGMRLAIKEWRVDFDVEDGRRLVVRALRSGYRPKQLATDPGLDLHREFTATFGR
ncbi:MAG TPA: tRNA (N6-threonylcarbamoyladenosine(37)-N6)-methyltransferase TrmO [Polyangiaceae bacterium]|jgi:tRNA-Thr(GGU) m(6)t(6)A37 methyltransferase TsaA